MVCKIDYGESIMAKQKFHRGDRVHIGKMPSYMAHFPSNCDAIVANSYDDEYGCDDIKSFGVYILPDGNYNAWYEECQLTKIKGPHGRTMAGYFKALGR